MSEKNNTVELKEKELKEVTGGNDTATYKYVFTDTDWVYASNKKDYSIAIKENVSTNDSSRNILCEKRRSGGSFMDEESPDNYYVSAGTLLSCYREHGGALHAM